LRGVPKNRSGTSARMLIFLVSKTDVHCSDFKQCASDFHAPTSYEELCMLDPSRVEEGIANRQSQN